MTLIALFPDSNAFLSLEPEDLGGVILEIAPNIIQNGMFNVVSVLEQLYPLTGISYPRNTRQQVELVIAEAINWLGNQGLLILAPGQPGTWYRLTRRAQTLRTRGDVEAYRKGGILPADLLQPILIERVRPLFLRGDYDIAVFQAYKIVEVAVRNAANLRGAGYPDDLVGVRLIRAAFNVTDGVLTDTNVVVAEREGEMHFFSGAIAHSKNPTGHRDVNLSPLESARLIVCAAHLLSIVEKRTTT